MIARHCANAADWRMQTVPISIIYPPAKRNHQQLRLFIDWIVERLGSGIGTL